ncbi:MAG: hypothetical protein ABSB33_00645 [Tepidisphaeraceae bacterium]|jgi:hypothetical protein
MTLYRMYVDNGNRAGFWVQHRSWSNACAQVQSIAGQRDGKLPGHAPLHDNADVVIRGFDVRSGRPVELGPRVDATQDHNYSVIAEPEWYRVSPLIRGAAQ